MLIKQLSIFLENKKGRFTEVAKLLGEAGINMSAFTVSENSPDCVGYRQGYPGITRASVCRQRRRCHLPALPQPAGRFG